MSRRGIPLFAITIRVYKGLNIDRIDGILWTCQLEKSGVSEGPLMKKIMFGNSLMLLGIAIMILAGLEVIYAGIMWASFLLIAIGFMMAVMGFFSKDS